MLSAKCGFGLSTAFFVQTPCNKSEGHIPACAICRLCLRKPDNEMHVWRHKNAYRSFCCISAHLSVWRDERDNREPWDTTRPSRNTSTATFSMIYACAQFRGGASGRSVINNAPHFCTARLVFIWCSPRSAPPWDNCNTQRYM